MAALAASKPFALQPQRGVALRAPLARSYGFIVAGALLATVMSVAGVYGVKFDHLDHATQLAQAGQLAKAVVAFERGLKVIPNDATLLNNAATAYWQYAPELSTGSSKQRAAYQRSLELYKRAIVWSQSDQAPDFQASLAELPRDLQAQGWSRDQLDVEPYLEDDEFDSSQGTLESEDDEETAIAQQNPEDVNLPEPPRLPKHRYRRAELLFDAGYRARAIRELCTKDRVRVSIPDDELAQNLISPRTLQKASAVLKVCGFVLLRNAFPKDLVREIHGAQDAWFNQSYATEIAADPRLASAETYETTTFAIRSKGRFEFSNPLRDPFTDPRIIQSGIVRPVLARTMGGNRLEIDTFSTVTSVPDTPIQHWHRDDGFLFTEQTQNSPLAKAIIRQRLAQYVTRASSNRRKKTLSRDDIERKIESMPLNQRLKAMTHSKWGLYSPALHLPPHGIVLFVPLRDVDLSMGPTQFLPGTHIHCVSRDQRERVVRSREFDDSIGMQFCPEGLNKILDTDADAGTALLFDFRATHRGGRNRHPVNRRPLMYMTFFQEWYYDKVNFHQRQTRKFDSWSPTKRKLLNRLDTKRYISALEQRLEDVFVETEDLQSSYEFDVYHYDEASQFAPV